MSWANRFVPRGYADQILSKSKKTILLVHTMCIKTQTQRIVNTDKYQSFANDMFDGAFLEHKRFFVLLQS